MQQYKKSENKWKKELKDPKKQKRIIYSIAKKSGSRREINNINKIRENILRRLSSLPVMIGILIHH